MLDAIALQKGDILIQSIEGSNYVIPHSYFIVERVNEYSISVSAVSLGNSRGDRHIRLTEPFKLRLNLKTFVYEYKDDTNACSFKKFDVNDYYSVNEGIDTQSNTTIFGTSPIARTSHIYIH
jgi:hypothetical protein